MKDADFGKSTLARENKELISEIERLKLRHQSKNSL